MHPASPIEIGGDDRAVLEKLARRGGNVGLHAMIVVAALRGDSIAEIARDNCSSRETVRKWLRIFRCGGVAALAGSVRRRAAAASVGDFPELRDVEIPPQLLAANRAPKLAARSARLRIACAVRDAIGRGRLLPGAPLPGRAWFSGRFHATAPVVNRAFADLAAGGFVESKRRSGTRVAARLPFDGRFLLVLESPNGDGSSGICENFVKAARETERRRRGLKWDVVWRTTENSVSIAVDLAMQRYAGAFMRFAHTETMGWQPGDAFLASVPGVPMAVDTIYRGTRVSPLVHELRVSRAETWAEVFADCAKRGLRRVMVVDAIDFRHPDPEASVRAAAARAGVSIPQFGYSGPFATATEESVRRVFAMQTRLVGAGDVDAILVRRDDLLRHFAPALRAAWGEAAAAAIPVLCWSAGTLLPNEGLAVQWHGFNLIATMLSFVDWAEAVRSGARNPPPPRAVWAQSG